MTEREKTALALLEAGALRLGETEAEPVYTWDGAAALADPGLRALLLDGLADMAADHYAQAQAVYGGDWAALLAARLGLPRNPPSPVARPLLALDAAEEPEALLALALPHQAGGGSPAFAAVFNCGRESLRRALDKADVRLHWLADLETAAAVALQRGYADFAAYDRVLEYLNT